MNKLKLLILLMAIFLNTGCVSIGPTVLIETPEPAEDFVVLCNWIVQPLFDFHGSGKSTKQNIYVGKSGEEIDCGVSLNGGDPAVQVMHPVYVGTGVLERDGVTVYQYTKTKLDVLDELKAKFEAEYWDKYRNPERSYLGSRPGCGFPYQYFDYYREAKEINLKRFKEIYSAPILTCLEKSYTETVKHDPYSAKQIDEPKIRILKFWESIEGEKVK